MGKKGKNFRKTNPKHSSDEETPAEDEKLSRDLKHGGTGAAFIHPLLRLRRSPSRQSRQEFVPETPASQNQIVSSSADSTAVVEETPRLFWDPQARKMVKSHVPKLLAKLGLKDVVPTTNAGDSIPSTSGLTPNVELLSDTIQLPTHPEFNLFNLRKNFPNSPVSRVSFREPTEESMENFAEEPIENLNDALEGETQAQFHQEAPIDNVLSESQILDQSTNDLDVNYDSFEFLNNASATREDDIAMLDHLLECMKYLSGVNVEFREFFHGDDALDENWPRGLEQTAKIETYEQCFSKIIEMELNEIYNFPDPNIFQRLIYRGPEVQRIFERKRRVLSIRAPEQILESPAIQVAPESPTPGPSNAVYPPEVPGAFKPQPEVTPAQNDEYGYFSDDDVPDKSLLIRLALSSEIMSIQLDNVLGRQAPPGPYLQDHERNTNYGINVRYNHIRASMKNREKEIPALNFSMSASVDHTRLISSEFLRASIQDVQTNQTGQSDQTIYDRVDFSNPQDDLNDNIQTNPVTNETNFSDDTGENYFTTSYPETSGTGLSGDTSENYQADNETTGPGNDTFDTAETGNYREEGEEIDPLANEGVNSFALLYNDGNAHFQGSAPDSSFNLSAIEPYVEEFDSYEAHDENDDVLDLELPFNFEHEFE